MKRIFKLTILIITMTLSNLTQAGVAISSYKTKNGINFYIQNQKIFQ